MLNFENSWFYLHVFNGRAVTSRSIITKIMGAYSRQTFYCETLLKYECRSFRIEEYPHRVRVTSKANKNNIWRLVKRNVLPTTRTERPPWTSAPI